MFYVHRDVISQSVNGEEQKRDKMLGCVLASENEKSFAKLGRKRKLFIRTL